MTETTKYEIEDNLLSLEDLVKQNDKLEDYEQYLDIVIKLIKEKYRTYRFLRVSPTHGDFNSGYFLSFTMTREDYPEDYEYLFRSAVSKGLTDQKINALFLDRVKAGEVLELGDVEIVEGTAISPATQADDIMVNIVFMPREYYNTHQELLAKQEG